MAINKKHKDKINESTINEWLSSCGFLFPTNEKELDRFNILYNDFEFLNSNKTIDVKAIINNTFKTSKIIPITNDDLNNEINELKMVARKGEQNIPKHIIDKMKNKHNNSRDDSE